MSQILKDLNKLAAKMGAPVVGRNISEQVRAISTYYDGTTHGANIAERINEVRHAWHEGSEPATLVEKSIIQNGIYLATDDEADGYSKVTVNVPPNVTTKSITANGTYVASADQVDGYSSVTVEVPSPSTPYLMSHGDEYILIDSSAISIPANPLLQMDYYISQESVADSQWHALFGCGYANANYQFSVMYNANVSNVSKYAWQRSSYYCDTNAIHGKCQLTFGGYGANAFNGTQAIIGSTAFSGSIDRAKFAIFARYLSSTSSIDATGIVMGIARLRIWDASTESITADLIPKVNPSTNKACLYDGITQTYYGNSNPESSTDFEIVEM